jgi:hypothetical protein
MASYWGKTGLKYVYVTVTLGLFALTLIVFMSCGGRAKHSGGLTSRINTGTNQTDGRGGPACSPEAFNNTGRTLSIEQVIAEVEAYEPTGNAAIEMDWHAFAVLKNELIKQLESRKERGVSSLPANSDRDTSSGGRDDYIDIPDLFVMPQLDGTNTITWVETLTGDFDGDGEVNVADITPIAVNYLKRYGQGYGDTVNDSNDRYLLYAKGTAYSEGTSDTDAATELGVPDITAIAQNYLMGPPSNGFAGYDVWRIPLAGGTPVRIPNPTDADAPSIVRTGMYEAGTSFTLIDDMSTAAPSSLRRTSGIDENGDGWSNGDYYYWIEPRDSEGTGTPSTPDAPEFNVSITYTTPFRLRAGQEVELKINLYGDATPISYGVNWGDGATDSGANTSMSSSLHTRIRKMERLYL